MNCQGFENIVNDLARQHLVDAKLREQALAHCNDCKACALRFENERVLTFGLAALSAEMRSLQVPERVEAELIAAWRQRKTLAQRSASQGSWRRLVASAAVAAAVVLIAFGANALRLLQTQSPKQMTIAPLTMGPEASPRVLPQAPDPSVEYSASSQLSGPRKTVKLRVAKHRPKPNDSSVAKASTPTAAIAQAVEVTTEFMPLGYVNAASLQDGGQVVRVELPRYAMARFGLPVNMDRYDERVKADVWVGADGLARAIRFVQ